MESGSGRKKRVAEADESRGENEEEKTVNPSSQRSFLVPIHGDRLKVSFEKVIRYARAAVRAHVLFLPISPVFSTQTTCHVVYPTSSLTILKTPADEQRRVVTFPLKQEKKKRKRGKRRRLRPSLVNNWSTRNTRMSVGSCAMCVIGLAPAYLTLLVFSSQSSLPFVPLSPLSGCALYLCLETRSSQFSRPLPPY